MSFEELQGTRGGLFADAHSLIYSELYWALAPVIRRFDMDLFETTCEDVDPKHDLFIPSPDPSCKCYQSDAPIKRVDVLKLNLPISSSCRSFKGVQFHEVSISPSV